MKLGPVTKLYNGNKTTSTIFDDDVMSKNCDVIVIYPIYDQFGAIQKPDSAAKTEKKKTKKSLTQLSHYCFE